METRQFIADFNPEAVMWDGLDDAVIGITNNGNVVYDLNKMKEILYKQWSEDPDDDVTMDDVVEHIDYNILGSYVGEFTPIHIIPVE